jgi:peptidoglycan/LPS O-acetylase OafA/YrhL
MQKMRVFLLFFFGLFLASYPPHGAAKALFWGPFHWLAKILVTDNSDADLYFYQTIASTLLVYVANRSPSLQKVFTTPLAIYLGKISFALYCVHQALINWFGYRTILLMWSYTGRDTLFRYEAGIVLTFIFQTILSIWAADVFWRFVDAPSVGFTKRVEKVCIGGSQIDTDVGKPR